MLKRYANSLVFLQSLMDAFIVAVLWTGVYFVRFKTGLFDISKGLPDFHNHVVMAIPIAFFTLAACIWTGLYQAKRLQNLLFQVNDILKATLIAGFLILTFLYYGRENLYSRKLLLMFAAMMFLGLTCSHLGTIIVLRMFRKRGYNLRHCAIIGCGRRGQHLLRELERIRWTGINCAYFVDVAGSRRDHLIHGVPVAGGLDRLVEIVSREPVDELYLTLSGDDALAAYPVLEKCQSMGITIRIIPDWGNLASTHATVTPIGSQLLFCAADSPLEGYWMVLKEIFDRAVALSLLLLLALPMLLIAAVIKLTSRGPVFYRQVRVGMDQRQFEIYKFRTMRIDAEQEGPRWASAGDARRTVIGSWLRKSSLDELPQLINVLRGDMSLVGPRPERPMFVNQFSQEYKNYMLRHSVKSGITGYAQIRGFRGNTSLRKRLQYDLFYVRNWSFLFDLWILLKTPWQMIRGKNAY
jgi:exopolysaccharide biosynthesis polyprenyl glycosylphosphotransferase